MNKNMSISNLNLRKVKKNVKEKCENDHVVLLLFYSFEKDSFESHVSVGFFSLVYLVIPETHCSISKALLAHRGP